MNFFDWLIYKTVGGFLLNYGCEQWEVSMQLREMIEQVEGEKLSLLRRDVNRIITRTQV